MVNVMKRTIKRMIVPIIVFLLLLNGLMYLRQPNMVFYPLSGHDQTPENWGLEYESVFLDAEDGVRLHGWYIPYNGASKVVLFFHGNAGNISHRGESIKIFHRLGLNVFILIIVGMEKVVESLMKKEYTTMQRLPGSISLVKGLFMRRRLLFLVVPWVA